MTFTASTGTAPGSYTVIACTNTAHDDGLPHSDRLHLGGQIAESHGGNELLRHGHGRHAEHGVRLGDHGVRRPDRIDDSAQRPDVCEP